MTKNKCIISKGQVALLIISATVFCLFIMEVLVRFSNLDDKMAGKDRKENNSVEFLDREQFSILDQQPSVLLRENPDNSTKTSHDMFRIVALGDSYTWGDKIPHISYTWPKQLEELLRDYVPGINTKVINFGVKGFTTVNELELLRRNYELMVPDLVILQFNYNDPLPSEGYSRVYVSWLKYHQQHLIKNKEIHGKLFHVSKLYRVFDHIYLAIRDRYYIGHKYDEIYDEDSIAWQRCVAAIEDMQRFLQERGSDFIVVVTPFLTPGRWTIETYPFQAIHQKIIDLLKDLKIDYVDMLPYILEKKKDLRSYWALDPHPDENMHRLYAEEIFRRLREKQFIVY